MSKKYLNPPGLFHHPNYTRVLTVEKPSKLIYIAGQTPADDNYQPLHPGDVRAQYIAVLEGLTLQLKAAGATWDDVVFPAHVCPRRAGVPESAQRQDGAGAVGGEPPVAQHAHRRNGAGECRISDRGRNHGRGGGLIGTEIFSRNSAIRTFGLPVPLPRSGMKTV